MLFRSSPWGWVALVDPLETIPDNVATNLIGGLSLQNDAINMNNTSNNVLLCPWFSPAVSVPDISDPSMGVLYPGPNTVERISYGVESPSAVSNNVKYGTKTYNGTHATLGRYTIVRWTSFSAGSLSQLIRFELVLYENGRIEFRYDPVNFWRYDDSTFTYRGFATVGIFMPGTNRFRDFSLGLGYLDSQRTRLKYGGAEYDPTFTDSGNNILSIFTTNNYVWHLSPATDWPGGVNGGMFVFSPPVNRRKSLPRLDIRRNDSLLRLPPAPKLAMNAKTSTGGFDDRKTVIYGDLMLPLKAYLNALGFLDIPYPGFTVSPLAQRGVINYPTTLQRFYGDSTYGAVDRHNLFSGDFEFVGGASKTASDEFVRDRKSTRLNSSHVSESRMPSSA